MAGLAPARLVPCSAHTKSPRLPERRRGRKLPRYHFLLPDFTSDPFLISPVLFEIHFYNQPGNMFLCNGRNPYRVTGTTKVVRPIGLQGITSFSRYCLAPSGSSLKTYWKGNRVLFNAFDRTNYSLFAPKVNRKIYWKFEWFLRKICKFCQIGKIAEWMYGIIQSG